MNKSAIQRFAIWARTELIAQVSQRAYQYGITKDGYGEANAVTVGGRALSTDEQRQRKELVGQIQQKNYTQVMEEVAYTWFNRFIALRFMEVNNYLPSHIRVFSDSTGAFKPEILNDVLHLELPGLNSDKVAEYIENNQTDDLYRYLLLTQCNALNEALPRMFERMGGYTELLLPNNILKQDGILGRMVTDIPEEDWTDQVQIIGWLYQYYNSELKDDTFALLKKNVKITKERIPSATQLFTPDWIVRYMVENSLGRIFIDKRKNEGVFADGRGADEMTWEESEAKRIANEKYIAEQMGWKYYLPEAEQTQEVRQQLDEIQREYANLDVREIRVIDPCMGSGHILVYAFDVLMQIYEANGYSQRDAAQSILKNNLYGLDIDDRAAQLAYFAVMMKARQYDRRIFSRGIQPHIYAIVESNGLDSSTVDYFTNNDPKLQNDFGTLREELRDAKEYGSILNISQVDFATLYARVEEVRNDISFHRETVLKNILPLIHVAEAMAQKYDVVATNPPYMGNNSFNTKLGDYVKSNYADVKGDLFAVMMTRAERMTAQDRYYSMITQQSWMFLSSYELLRDRINKHIIINLAHLGSRAFDEISGEMVSTTAFVNRNSSVKLYKGLYSRLVDYQGEASKECAYLQKENMYVASQANFEKIPGIPIAYWITDGIANAFEKGCSITKYVDTFQGIITGDNDKFLRLWYEVSASKIPLHAVTMDDVNLSEKYWIPYNKGGEFRKWYGGQDYVVFWRFGPDDKTRGKKGFSHYYLREYVAWSYTISNSIATRYYPQGFLWDVRGSGLMDKSDMLLYLEGLISSKIGITLFRVNNSTLSCQVENIIQLPIIFDATYKEAVDLLVNENNQLSQSDWDSCETSWDFKRHPMV